MELSKQAMDILETSKKFMEDVDGLSNIIQKLKVRMFLIKKLHIELNNEEADAIDSLIGISGGTELEDMSNRLYNISRDVKSRWFSIKEV